MIASLDAPVETALFVLALFFLSFSFSGTETALFSLQKVDRQRLSRAGPTGRRIVGLLSQGRPLITTILIGNETVNVILGATGAALFAALAVRMQGAWFDSALPWLNILVLTPLLILVSEITPKVLAYRYNTTWARVVAWPLTGFAVLAWPLRVAISGLVGVVARSLFRVNESADESGLHEAELRSLLDEGAATGQLDEVERDIIESVFEFGETTVGREMTPRPDVFSVPLHIAWTDLLERVRTAGFSRIPVYDKGPNDIVGVLLLRDLLKVRNRPPSGPRQLRSMLMPPSFVPASKPADVMLREFMDRKFHMALVVDEHGTLVGLVTLDDLLAELVGDIFEFDEEEEDEIREGDAGRWTVKAWMDVDDFTEETAIDLPEGDYHTLGGFVFHALGRLPTEGDEVALSGHRFVVGAMEGRRISEILVDPQDDEEGA